MKVLTIIGSPRKNGNSYQAAKKLEDNIKHKGDYQFEYLFLRNFNLQDCKGCFNCRNYAQTCVLLMRDLGPAEKSKNNI